jgi:hypothetical protein
MSKMPFFGQLRNRLSNHCASLALVACAGLMFAYSAACSTADNTAKVVVVTPDKAQYEAVDGALSRSCGSVDCHGNANRNWRMVGFGSRRLDPAANPAGPGTSPAELDVNFASLVTLEPELVAAVTNDKGVKPERLSLFRKGRGLDNHKGGVRLIAGNVLEKCIVSWFAGKTDNAICQAAATGPATGP